MRIRSAQTVSLKTHPEVNEAAIQEFIFNDPSVLGLGDISPIRRERKQPSGGRVDMLLGNDDTRYEVEIMLGATDPSHIIRTIEYWDIEKKRFPRYNHVAVIIAEDITARFLNVISLFNGMIPLIAIQMVATQNGEELLLSFVKILDYTELREDEESEAEPTDRKYWESRSNSNILKDMDEIFSFVVPNGYELKYNKFYIGVSKDSVTSNFIFFKPNKKFMYLYLHLPETEETSSYLDKAKLTYDYEGRDKAYKVRFSNIKDFQNNKEIIKQLVVNAMELRNLAGID